jgi:hypothetical protein
VRCKSKNYLANSSNAADISGGVLHRYDFSKINPGLRQYSGLGEFCGSGGDGKSERGLQEMAFTQCGLAFEEKCKPAFSLMNCYFAKHG